MSDVNADNPMMRPVIAVFWSVLSVGPVFGQASFPFFQPVQPPRAVQVIAHRGLQSLAPANSTPAVLACAEDYIEWAAIDVQLTRDGRHVVIHGERVDDITAGRGRVADLTLAELQRLDAGSWFAPRFNGVRLASLPELLAAARGRVNLVLRCRQADPDRLAREITGAAMESQVIVAGSTEFLAQLRQHAADRVARLAHFDPAAASIDELVSQLEPAAVEIEADDVTAAICSALQSRGIRVAASLLGAERENAAGWANVLEAGVDWVLTDDPAGVRFAEVRRRIDSFPVQIAFHRGAGRYAPENTLPAIRIAAALGADYIEVDIRTTSDGAFVLLHDRTLERTTNGRGPVAEATAAAIAELDAGSWFGKPFAGVTVPRWDEALAAAGRHSAVYLDAKDIAPGDLLSAIGAHELMARHVVYQGLDYCRELRALDPSVRLLPPLRTPEDLDAVAALAPYGVDARWTILSRELIERCHAAGIRVFSDALGPHESVDEYRKAIGWGIDVIQTDYPLRVLRAIELEVRS